MTVKSKQCPYSMSKESGLYGRVNLIFMPALVLLKGDRGGKMIKVEYKKSYATTWFASDG